MTTLSHPHHTYKLVVGSTPKSKYCKTQSYTNTCTHAHVCMYVGVYTINTCTFNGFQNTLVCVYTQFNNTYGLTPSPSLSQHICAMYTHIVRVCVCIINGIWGKGAQEFPYFLIYFPHPLLRSQESYTYILIHMYFFVHSQLTS